MNNQAMSPRDSSKLQTESLFSSAELFAQRLCVSAVKSPCVLCGLGWQASMLEKVTLEIHAAITINQIV